MSGSSKRLWSPNLSFEDVRKLVLNFLIRCRDKNILTNKPVTLYKVYKFEQQWPVNGMTEISHYLRFSKNDTPDIDRTRDVLVRLLSVVLKSHFFIDENAIVRNEPYVFMVPDLSKPGSLQYGLVYQIEANNKVYNIIVAEWDLNLSNSTFIKTLNNNEQSIILSENSFKWLEVKKWREYKNQITSNYSPYVSKDNNEKKNFYQAVNKIKDKSDFNFGTIINYNAGMKDFISYSGCEWAFGIKSWFIPNGLDVISIKEYLDYIEKLNEDERYQLKWWSKNKTIVENKENKLTKK